MSEAEVTPMRTLAVGPAEAGSLVAEALELAAEALRREAGQRKFATVAARRVRLAKRLRAAKYASLAAALEHRDVRIRVGAALSAGIREARDA